MAFLQKKGRFDPPWLSISDMMTILMFLFLLSFFVIIGENDIARIRADIKKELKFTEEELQRWKAAVNPENGDVSIQNIDFDSGSFTLKPHHKVLLDEFFPKFVGFLSKYSNDITDIKIEGHTDTDGAYLMNLRLSQDRSREVLSYLIQSNPQWELENPWFFKKMSASGRSESLIVYTNKQNDISYGVKNPGYTEDKTRSRRVVFRFILREANFTNKNQPASAENPPSLAPLTNNSSTKVNLPGSSNTQVNKKEASAQEAPPQGQLQEKRALEIPAALPGNVEEPSDDQAPDTPEPKNKNTKKETKQKKNKS